MVSLTPPISRTLADQVATQLRQQIVTGALAPGTQLVEQWLVETMHVSRSTVRESLGKLAADGLVEIMPHRGARVAELTERDAAEICDVFAVLEGHAAAIAPLPPPADVVAKLVEVIDNMAKLTLPRDLDDFITLDRRFHRTLVQLAAQRRLESVWEQSSGLLAVVMASAVRVAANDGPTIAARHQLLLDAAQDGGPERLRAEITHHYQLFDTDRGSIG